MVLTRREQSNVLRDRIIRRFGRESEEAYIMRDIATDLEDYRMLETAIAQDVGLGENRDRVNFLLSRLDLKRSTVMLGRVNELENEIDRLRLLRKNQDEV